MALISPTYVYKNQTALTIQLTVGQLVNYTRVLIKFQKPNGLQGFWVATVDDASTGLISTNVTSGLEDTGWWTFWSYIYYKDGTVAPGSPVQMAVYEEGEMRLDNPFGTIPAYTEVTTMATEAFEILYTNTTSGLTATNVQEALDEIDADLKAIATPTAAVVTYDNTNSNLAATNVQAAIDLNAASTATNKALLALATKILYVDNGRTDTYTETGTISQPFKTLAGAASAATSGTLIRVNSGTYVENIGLPNGVSLFGTGMDATVINGTLAVGSGSVSLRDLTVTGSITFNGNVAVWNVLCQSAVTVNANLQGFKFNIAAAIGPALTVAGGYTVLEAATVSTADGSSCISQTGGTANVSMSTFTNNSSTNATILSTAGIFRGFSSTFTNQGTGNAVTISNAATSTTPNMLVNILHTGAIASGSSYTIYEGIFGGDPSGTSVAFNPATQVGFDPTNTSTKGITGTTVQSAMEQVVALLP